jgi:hypothetical protein
MSLRTYLVAETSMLAVEEYSLLVKLGVSIVLLLHSW